MADKYDSMIDAVSAPASGVDRYDSMIDAVSDGQSVQKPSENGPSGYSADAGHNPDEGKFLAESMLTNNPTDFAGSMLRSLPATVLGAIAGPPGAAAGEALRQAGVSGYSTATGQAPTSPLGIAGHVAAAGALQKASDVAAPYLAQAITSAGEMGGQAVKDIARYVGVNIAGVKTTSYAVAEGAPAGVKGYLGAEPAVGDQLAEDVRGAIGSAVKKGENSYAALIDAAKANPAYAGKTIDLQAAVGDKVLEIADKHGFQSVPGLDATGEGDKFWKFAGQVDGLKNAPVEQVYNFQKQLNGLAQSNRGTALGNAFGQLKTAVNGVLGKEIPEIGQANASYAAAKTLEEQTGKLTGNNDLLAHITRVFRNPQDTLQKQAIEGAYPHVPGLEDAVNKIQQFAAAKDFTPLVRSLPQTGMGASIAQGFVSDPIRNGLAVGYLGGPVAGVGAGALTLGKNVTTSPRLALTALEAAQGASPVLGRIADAAARGTQAATPAFAQALGAMAPESIAAYYRSPGVK